MKKTSRIQALTIALAATASLYTLEVAAQSSQASSSGTDAELELAYNYFWVEGDKGRFREDNWISSDATFGIKYLLVENFNNLELDLDDFYYRLEGHAMYDYDYDFSLLISQNYNYYFQFDASSTRRYFDGSNEYWDQTLYGFLNVDPRGTSEHPDEDMYVDRRNYGVEFGWTPEEGITAKIGWKRMEREGRETLLRGSRARVTGDTVPRFRGIPAVANVDGTTDTFYLELSNRFADKYNVTFRQEYEDHKDNQQIVFPRYLNGVIEQDRNFFDVPSYHISTSLLMVDSHLDDTTYVNANLMYSDLENNTARESRRLNLANPNHFIDTEVENTREVTAGGFAFRKSNFMKEDLTLSGGIRVEDSRTEAMSSGLAGGATLREAVTDMDKVKISENIRLVYKGKKNATFSFDANLKQMGLDWSENADIRSHEIFNKPSAQSGGIPAGVNGILVREADIDHFDQKYELKAVFRQNNASRTTIALKYKDLDREYDEVFDNDPLYYPGHIGDYKIKGTEFLIKNAQRLESGLRTNVTYKYIDEKIDTDIGGQTQELKIHRLSGSASGAVNEVLFLTGTVMYDDYGLNTPAVGIGGAIKNASNIPSRYDYTGDSYSILANGSYLFGYEKQNTCLFGYQHTEAMGAGNSPNDSSYDKLHVMFKLKTKENQSVSLGYQYIDFDNQAGDNWDDYTANGATVTYAFAY